eukprot:Seg6392.1 transcript_id=Seg6392.1/GoldUCD/mRNA.D3Y31 product=Syntaxin-6 protein_id=Seg6392.1/GoldUCD/D3Y31
MEDPFFVVRDEVQKAVNSVQELYRRWQDLLNNTNSSNKEEYNWTSNEIKNSVRSVEWDLEDLEETIGIVESNPNKFTLAKDEIENRKGFIKSVRRTIQSIKEDVNSPEVKAKVEKNSRQALVGAVKYQSGNKYSRLENDMEKSNQRYIDETQHQQQQLMRRQDEQLVDVSQSVGVLKSIGVRIDSELDEQSVLLDDLGNEIEMTDSKLQTILVRVEKVLKLADDKKQTYVLITLIVLMVIVIILFVAI